MRTAPPTEINWDRAASSSLSLHLNIEINLRLPDKRSASAAGGGNGSSVGGSRPLIGYGNVPTGCGCVFSRDAPIPLFFTERVEYNASQYSPILILST